MFPSLSLGFYLKAGAAVLLLAGLTIAGLWLRSHLSNEAALAAQVQTLNNDLAVAKDAAAASAASALQIKADSEAALAAVQSEHSAADAAQTQTQSIV
jgi:hypothetical protein